MANDADEVIVGQSGQVYVAPVGTTMPLDTATAMSGSWIDLGFLTEDGVTFTPELETFEVPAWQSQGRPVRRGVASRSEAVSFTMLQWNEQNLQLAFGGGEITEIGTSDVYKYTPPNSAEEDEHAFVVEWEDGGELYRLLIYRASVTDLAEFNLVRTDAAGLNVTIGLVNDGTTDPWNIITENAAWAPA